MAIASVHTVRPYKWDLTSKFLFTLFQVIGHIKLNWVKRNPKNNPPMSFSSFQITILHNGSPKLSLLNSTCRIFKGKERVQYSKTTTTKKYWRCYLFTKNRDRVSSAQQMHDRQYLHVLWHALSMSLESTSPGRGMLWLCFCWRGCMQINQALHSVRIRCYLASNYTIL